MKAAKEYTEGPKARESFNSAMKALFQTKKTASSAKPKAAQKPKRKA